MHVVGAQWWERRGHRAGRADDVAARALAALGAADRLALDATKIMVDGVAENQTAAMLTPYRTCTDTTRPTTDSRSSTRCAAGRVTALDAAGMQVHFHALGDRAVREALDAVEAARAANGASDGRHHLAHLQVVDEAEVPRFAELTRWPTSRRCGRPTRSSSTS